jgi:SAM-dependent methyltransferase
VHEILDHLPNRARVLDLGARDGSFPADQYPHLQVVRVDLTRPGQDTGNFVLADAAQLPFPAKAFDAVILNHSLEHFDNLTGALVELGRIVKPEGAAFVAVPDASTFSDRLYRKVLIEAGGHVNLFSSEADLATLLTQHLGLPHAHSTVLYGSFDYLNPRNIADLSRTRHIALSEPLLFLLNAAARAVDRRFHTRMSVYGWALYFGHAGAPVASIPRTNVCLRCGTGRRSDVLERLGAVERRWFFFRAYRCAECGALNPYSRDRDFASPVG